LEKIDASHYKYSMLPAYVNIIRNEDGTWYYTRLKNISRSIDFYTLQECLEIAYYDMLASNQRKSSLTTSLNDIPFKCSSFKIKEPI